MPPTTSFRTRSNATISIGARQRLACAHTYLGVCRRRAIPGGSLLSEPEGHSTCSTFVAAQAPSLPPPP